MRRRRVPLVVATCLLAAACSAEEDSAVPAPGAGERRAVAEAQAMIPEGEQAAASEAAKVSAAAAPATGGPAAAGSAPARAVKPQFSTPLPQASPAE